MYGTKWKMSKASLAGLVTVVLLHATGIANAALQGRAPLTAGGADYQAYYDTDLNITWVADANLAKTSGFSPDGLMRWDGAQLWITSLNAQNGGLGYLGVNNWRLPTVTDTGTPGCDFAYAGTDCGYHVDVSTSEMAHMYFITLGNTGGPGSCAFAGPNYCLTNTGPFSNLLPYDYWSGTLYVPDFTFVWEFNFTVGDQNDHAWYLYHYAWAVAPGDPLLDTDGDSIRDPLDNCTLVPNPDQYDADGDGYGNACDGDLDNDGQTNIVDYSKFRTALGGDVNTNPLAAAADINHDGVVNIVDYSKFRALLGKPPGPSGLHP